MEGDELIKYLDKIEDEGKSAQAEKIKEYETYIDCYRGDIWKRSANKPRVKIVANHLKEIVTRKVALMTDVTPQIEILPTDDSLFDTCKVLKEVFGALWEQYSWSDTLQEIIYFNMFGGYVFADTTWDGVLNWGGGDININVGDPRQYIIDPFVTRSNKLYEAEYIIKQSWKVTAELRVNNPDKYIPSDLEVTKDHNTGMFQRALSAFGYKQKSGVTPAIERSMQKCYWIKDRQTEDEEHEGKSKKKSMYPSGRFIKRVGNTILDDFANPFWDGRFPIDMMDWQFDPESPFGMSEVKDLASPFKAYNKLLSLIIENVLLNISPWWVTETDALTPSEREKVLTNKPGQIITVRPGKKLERVSPPELSSAALASTQFLRSILDDVSGMSEVTRGKKGGQSSAAAIESLGMNAQSIIRYQSRRLESFMQRIGQKIISRIFQYYTNDRLMWLLGDSKEMRSFKFERDKIIQPLLKMYKSETSNISQDDINTYVAKKAFKNFRFHVVAGSSMAMTKVQRAQLAMALYKMGILDDQAVMEIMEYPNWKAILERKKQGKTEAPQPSGKVKVPGMITDKGLPSKAKIT